MEKVLKDFEDMIFDTHAHYDDEQFDADRDALLKSFPENGIGGVVNVSASLESICTTLSLSERYPWMFAAVGIHPDDAGTLNEENFKWLSIQAQHEKCVSIGEIGLDYYWDKADRKVQKKWFVRQIELAKQLKLPIIVHSREAAKDTLDVMKEADAGDAGGVVHCYSYSWEMAREYLKMGFYLGVGGVLTFKNAQRLKEVVEKAPLERLVLETDSPYLSPVPFRGKRNSSLNLLYVAQELARIKEVSVQEVLDKTWDNAVRMYRLSDRMPEGREKGK